MASGPVKLVCAAAKMPACVLIIQRERGAGALGGIDAK